MADAILRYFENEIFETKNNNNDILSVVLDLLNLNEDKREKAKNLYLKNSEKIVSSLKKNDCILVNGEVQSGKTNNLIISASTLNNERKYDLIIYLTGRLNKINNQNHSRFFDSFEKFDNYLLQKVINPEEIKESTVNEVREGKTLLINMLKESDRIAKLKNFIERYNLSFLLINDEGDDASLSESGMNVFNDLKEIKVNKKIITITGSPYPNLANEEIYDDYIILESSEFYTGIDKFNYSELESDDMRTNINNVLLYWIEDTLEIENSSLLLNLSTVTDDHDMIALVVQEELFKIYNNSEIPDQIKDVAKMIDFEGKIEKTNISNEISDSRGKKIIIGGHNLSRGVTFEDLTHEMLISNSIKIKASTLIQRARWCGYRDTSKTKIYLSKNLIQGFKELINLQEWTKEYKFGSKNYKNIFKEKSYEVITL